MHHKVKYEKTRVFFFLGLAAQTVAGKPVAALSNLRKPVAAFCVGPWPTVAACNTAHSLGHLCLFLELARDTVEQMIHDITTGEGVGMLSVVLQVVVRSQVLPKKLNSILKNSPWPELLCTFCFSKLLE